ncbi:restriction endonuclease subunit S [Streptococcus mitis]|jgi:type I restriction modification DNA specificity domain protein|uniref:Restriction endonuclease subunit S n=1 Tax=Streptococcus mitis TaxID=28037 RepID=A0A1S9ZDS0_STRMT|nr:restriction endonuclease subunit S [Streptococcus mitis]OOR81583.1 restriction endonuclease subunit S [Streptococcus mitis]
MSTRKEKIPTVRFRAFSEPWFQNQLSEVAEFSKGRGYSKKDIQPQGTPIILYGRLYTKYESVISNIDTYANMEKNSVISEGGEVIIPASGESAAEISRASCVTDGGVILGGDINIVKPHESLDSSFIAITLSNGSQQRELSKRAQGKSVVHLHNSDLKAVKLFYPSYEEQFAIGSLFRNIDDLLASYKDNLINYQSLKATMLSKMFPKAGQTVPEIRLDGFEGEWKVQSLKELARFSKGNGYTKSDLVNSGNEIILYGQLYTNYQTVISMVNTFVLETREKSVISKGGEVVVPASGESAEDISRASVIEKSGVIIGGDLNIIYPDENKVDSIFLALTISNGSQQKELIKRAQGKSVVHLRNNDLEKVVLHYPSMEEQQAIGVYFSNLDNLINSHQEKISQLEILKKKLLQDMFI